MRVDGEGGGGTSWIGSARTGRKTREFMRGGKSGGRPLPRSGRKKKEKELGYGGQMDSHTILNHGIQLRLVRLETHTVYDDNMENKNRETTATKLQVINNYKHLTTY